MVLAQRHDADAHDAAAHEGAHHREARAQVVEQHRVNGALRPALERAEGGVRGGAALQLLMREPAGEHRELWVPEDVVGPRLAQPLRYCSVDAGSRRFRQPGRVGSRGGFDGEGAGRANISGARRQRLLSNARAFFDRN